MELPQYLLSVATRHELAKDEHQEEIKEFWLRKKKNNRTNFKLTYEDELKLLKGIIGSVSGKPKCLRKMTSPALGALAYILKAKIADDPYILGHEIVNKLVCNPELTIVYLNGFRELKDLEWIRLIEKPGIAFTDQPPFCWLQANIELGKTFHLEMGVVENDSRMFTSNDAYLDAVFAYIQALIDAESCQYRVNNIEADLATIQPDGSGQLLQRPLLRSSIL